MILGLGNDIISVTRIQDVIARRGKTFLDRTFTSHEQEYCETHRESFRNYAGRFAAKEAIVKALGSGFSGGISWLDLEIRNNAAGKPEVFLSPKLQQIVGNNKIFISISHCDAYAAAVALIAEDTSLKS